ncbi:hypothetical protein ANCCEY_04650 [Ancylostoma ceylanicum]|uniref:Neurotransmitter-gated ion-channel ligand-binding domain-containing protein n=1 Tax=Ancylostoma ceylanicum TaxID=53326 RepID=A0A0D6LYF3_9BILA|nr:hypothetical protein ANCCEY_04650 [Ancylostoma ceylanicum]
MLLVTVCCLALIHIYVQADCPIVDRDTYLHEQSRLYKNLLKDYDPRLPAVTMQAAYSSLNLLNASANLPKYEVLLTLVFMKMIRMASFYPSHTAGVGRHSSEDYREDYKKFIYVRFKPLEIIPSISRISGGREPGTTGRKFEVPAKWRPNFWNLKDRFVQDFPFDHQECDIQIMSQSFSAWLYGINATLSPSLANNATAIAVMGNGEWQIKNVSVRSEFVDSGQEFPFQLASVLVILGMALTNIMSVTFILGILATALPKTKELPKIDKVSLRQPLSKEASANE